jgi:hypothetical protein
MYVVVLSCGKSYILSVSLGFQCGTYSRSNSTSKYQLLVGVIHSVNYSDYDTARE